MDLNLGIKSCVTHVLLHLPILLLLFTSLLSIFCVRSPLLSVSLVALIMFTFVLFALQLVDYLILYFIILPCSRLYSLTHF
jgi:hypothetical protein